jgi:hypothetical protein
MRFIQIDELVRWCNCLALPGHQTDFFLWDHLKHFVYATPINNMDELMERITAAIGKFNAPMLQRVQENLIQRLTLCIEVEGRHFEQLL